MRDWGLQEPLVKAVRAAFIVVLHTAVVTVIISCMWLVEHLIIWLWASGEPMFLGVPLHEITQGAELIVLFVFLGSGTFSAALAFWR
jgi:hypothetical protein